MSLQGPIIVVAEAPAGALAEALANAGAFPIVEVRGNETAAAVASVEPAAVVMASIAHPADPAFGEAFAQVVKARPYVPVLTCLAAAQHECDELAALDHALPIDAEAPPARLIARLRAALRVRTLHAAVLRRTAAASEQGGIVPDMPQGDPLGDATVLLTGRGRSYPALSVAIGERVNVIGALSLEAAAGVLKARDIDGVVIGEGFNKRMVDNFLAE